MLIVYDVMFYVKLKTCCMLTIRMIDMLGELYVFTLRLYNWLAH